LAGFKSPTRQSQRYGDGAQSPRAAEPTPEDLAAYWSGVLYTLVVERDFNSA
jgi:hypothetical protein